MIPNTTPTPNELYNGEMKKMSDTELRVVLMVTRATFGWIIDKETGMRKIEDWISHSQLIKKSGRSSSVISKAIDSCVKNEWIETRDKSGKLLETPNERRRRRIYYRLGKIFLDKVSTKESKVDEISKKNLPNLIKKSTLDSKVNLPNKLWNTKEIITKEIIQKNKLLSKTSFAGKEINLLIERFKEVNPSYEQLFKNKSQRSAMERLVKKYGVQQVEKMIDGLQKIFGQPYAPTITTPYLLELKLADYISYIKKEKLTNNKAIIL